MLQPIRALQREMNMAVILVKRQQNVREAMKSSDRVVVMKAGQVILETVPEELSDNTSLMELSLPVRIWNSFANVSAAYSRP